MNCIVTNGSTSPLKKKKKNIKTRGTSLLAQPSLKASKLSNISTNNNPSPSPKTISLTSIRQITTTRPLSTLLTINKQQTNSSRPSLPHSNITSNITSYSSLCSNSQQVLRKHNLTNTINTTITNTKTTNHTPTRIGPRHQSLVSISTAPTHLTELEKTARYCVKVEHAYSLLS